MEVLAGGGAILAKTGQKVSVEEAELIATKVNRPDTVIEPPPVRDTEMEQEDAPSGHLKTPAMRQPPLNTHIAVLVATEQKTYEQAST
mmetsp:Transcript_5797/g.6560  ORF Transcript_5797/g.6560 Transcript_5797/m.6560 type:complete len:88 (+) Transcript_5797:3-266(+)